MFRGRSVHTLDGKGRIRIPSRFREILRRRFDDQLIVTNLDRCLTAYPLSEWEKIEERLGELSLVRQDVKAFQRFFISGATECNFDKQGRILIPPILREHWQAWSKALRSGPNPYGMRRSRGLTRTLPRSRQPSPNWEFKATAPVPGRARIAGEPGDRHENETRGRGDAAT
jgi:MraZ protein